MIKKSICFNKDINNIINNNLLFILFITLLTINTLLKNGTSTNNIISNNSDINFISKNNMTQEGTNVYASNSNGTGTISYDIANDLDIIASKDTYSMTSETETKNAGGSVGNNAIQLNYGQSESNSRIFSTTYNNVDIIANNINIKTGNDTDIKGANMLAQTNENNVGGNINMDIGNNLNIESLQDSYYAKSKSSSFGVSFGGGKTASGGNSASAGFNFGRTNSTTDSQWVNEQTSIIADNNINIRTNNNTNLIGSVVASNSDNLSLTTNSLTYQDLNDYYTSTTKGNGLTTNIGTSSESFFKGIAPNGTTTITLVNSGEDKKQDTRATIGNGNITIGSKEVNEENNNQNLIAGLNRDTAIAQETTQDQITGALNGEMKIDNRIFTPDGLVSIYSDAKNLAGNTKEAIIGASKEADRIIEGTYRISEKVGEAVGGDTGKTIFSNVLKYTIGSTIGGAISAFGEDGRKERNFVSDNNKYYNTLEEALKDNPDAKNYSMGGIMTDEKGAEDVIKLHRNTIARVNASDGLVGDLLEAGITSLLGLTSFTSDFSALGRMQANDLSVISNTPNNITHYNTHSEATIGYNNGLKISTNISSNIDYGTLGYAIWENNIKDISNKSNLNIVMDRDEKDPVQQLAAPKGALDFIYGIGNVLFNKGISKHGINNQMYDKYFDETNLIERLNINQSKGITTNFKLSNPETIKVKYYVPNNK